MPHLTLRQEYMELPPVTRTYTTACIITTILVQLDILSPFQLYFNPILIFKHYQFWRLITTFLYFGTLGFNFFFNIGFTYRYFRMLEEGSFRNRTADFVLMMLFGAVWMIICGMFCSLLFLGQAFTIMVVYIWARRNPLLRIHFFGIFNLQAPYLPWTILGFGILFGHSIFVDLLGIAIGHFYFFLEDIFPQKSGGIRVLKTPRFLKQIFEPRTEEPVFVPEEERPGGFPWGAEGRQPD